MPQVGELSVLFTGNDAKLTAVTAHAQRSLGRFASQARGALAAAGLALSFAGVTAAVRSFVNAAAEQEVAEKKLATALGRTSQILIDQATALQKVTTASDEQIVMAQASIAAFVKSEDRIKALTKAALDFASAQGTDVVSAGQLLAKTLGSDSNALGRYGIKVEGAANSTQRFEQIINGVARLFGGQAQSATTTFSGRVSVLKNRFGEVAEELGRKLIPSLEKLIVKLSENADAIGSMASSTVDATLSWGKYAAGILLVTQVLKAFGLTLFSTEKSLLTLAATAGGVVVLSFAAIGLSVANYISGMKDGTYWTDKFVDALNKMGRNPIEGIDKAIHAVNLEIAAAKRELDDATGAQEQLAIRQRLTALYERGRDLQAEASKLQKDQGLGAEFEVHNAEALAKWNALVTKSKEKQAAVQAKVTVMKSPAALAPGLGPVVDKVTAGLTGARNAAKKLFSEMIEGAKKFAEAREDLLGKVRMFGVEGLDAAIDSIRQQRDELMKEAAKLGLLPQVSGQIKAAAEKQIDAATRDANRAFEDRVGGFGANEQQQNQAAIQDVIRERDAIIKEAEALGLLTDELRAQVNARAEQAAAKAITPSKTPEFVGIQEAWSRMQKSIFDGEAQKEALMLAKAQLKKAEEAEKKRDEIAKAGVRAADGIDRLIVAFKSQSAGVFD